MNKIEIIRWVDSAGSEGWNAPEDKCEVTECVSVGWITAESKTAITVTSHIDEENNNHHSDMTIPKVAITSRKVIRGKAKS